MKDPSVSGFLTTHWTRVLATRGESPEARQALRDLCEAYYGPVEAFITRYRSGHDDARDLTHAFFARLLEGSGLAGIERTRGRFRSYLLGAVKHFLADERDRALAEKRGHGQGVQSLDARPGPDRFSDDESPPLAVADPHGFPPDSYFDHEWALAVVEKAMTGLLAESEENGNPQRFAVLRPWLIALDDRAAAIEAARSLGMSDGAFKVAVHRLRKRFRQLVKDQIASTIDDPAALRGELDYLIQALTAAQPGSKTMPPASPRG
jgi:RNA polymerase sigma-70 factor (ECF subfamily)